MRVATPEPNPAILLHLYDGRAVQRAEVEEFRELATAAAIEPQVEFNRRLNRINSKYYIGSGLVEELEAAKEQSKLLVINQDLSPIQQRNLERQLRIDVLSFSELVLNIFSARARSFEGKLQIELAQLKHQATRLVRGWSHLQRQRGGLGWRGGQGETQIEIDRRLIRQRIRSLQQRLEKVKRQRQLGRRARQALPTVALVGYTNAGKSTLFNKLCRSDTLVADKLFATLDPLLRRCHIEGLGAVVIADTVGFIRRLPHELIEAFISTLQETSEADLLLHVVDCSDPDYLAKSRAVEQTLEQIGAADLPRIRIFNKADLLPEAPQHPDNADSIYLSALADEGIVRLRALVAAKLAAA